MKFYLIIFILCLLVLSSTVNAQETEDSEAADQIRNAVKEAVKEKIENVTSRKLGLVGTLTLITENTLELDAGDDKFVIMTSDNTEYEKVPGSSSLDRDELELNSNTIILGTESPEDEESVDANVIQLIEEPEVPVRETLFGTVENVNGSRLLLLVESDELTIEFTRSTDIYIKNDNGEVEDASFRDLEVGDTVIAGNLYDEAEDTYSGLLIIKISSVDESEE